MFGHTPRSPRTVALYKLGRAFCAQAQAGRSRQPRCIFRTNCRRSFPDETALIERLARDNYVFKRLAVRYDDINRQIHRIESEDQPAEDAVLERLKKDRLKLKDEIAHMLTRENRRM